MSPDAPQSGPWPRSLSVGDKIAIGSVPIGIGGVILSIVIPIRYPHWASWMVDVAFWGGIILFFGGIIFLAVVHIHWRSLPRWIYISVPTIAVLSVLIWAEIPHPPASTAPSAVPKPSVLFVLDDKNGNLLTNGTKWIRPAAKYDGPAGTVYCAFFLERLSRNGTVLFENQAYQLNVEMGWNEHVQYLALQDGLYEHFNIAAIAPRSNKLTIQSQEAPLNHESVLAHLGPGLYEFKIRTGPPRIPIEKEQACPAAEADIWLDYGGGTNARFLSKSSGDVVFAQQAVASVASAGPAIPARSPQAPVQAPQHSGPLTVMSDSQLSEEFRKLAHRVIVLQKRWIEDDAAAQQAQNAAWGNRITTTKEREDFHAKLAALDNSYNAAYMQDVRPYELALRQELLSRKPITDLDMPAPCRAVDQLDAAGTLAFGVPSDMERRSDCLMALSELLR